MSVVALGLCALMASGCVYGTAARIDPSGEHVLIPGNAVAAAPPAAVPSGPFYEEPGGQLPWDDVAVTLSPRVTVAPIDSEVVLLAGVRGPDNYLMTNRRLEWTLSSGGVGHVVDVGKNGLVDWLLADFNMPRKVDGSYAVGSTSRYYLRLTRGTPTPADDVYVLAGQGWITVTSPVEGSSHVTVLAPEVYLWNARTQSATIHWIDAQWAFPPPAINPAGTRHTFTTAVMRHSDQYPCVGWSVRYEIVEGPAAGFAPDGSRAVEVATDPAGQARAEIFQRLPAAGTNRVAIQIIRPGTLPGADGRRLVVGNGTTLKTWTAAAIALHKTGPAVASVGAVLTFRSEICNPGDQPARDVLLMEQVPEGLSYVGSNPAAEVAGKTLRWRLGPLGGGQRWIVDVNYRAEKQGSVTDCAEATAAGGLKAADCATTTISAAAAPAATAPASASPLELKITAPPQVSVGGKVSFEMLVANRGQTPLSNVVIKDTFAAGLEHDVSQSPILRKLGNLAAGESQVIHVTFTATKVGSLCHTVELTADNGLRTVQTACVTAVGAGALPGPGAAATPAAPLLAVSVKAQGTAALSVGETAEFTIDIVNNSDRAVSNLSVVAQCDAGLRAIFATLGYKPQTAGLAWTIDTLGAGQANELKMICRGVAAAARACVHVTVSTPDGSPVKDESCIAVREAPAATPPGGAAPPESPPAASSGDLTLKITALTKRPPVGREFAYEISVSNEGKTADQLVNLVVNVPAGMTPVPLGTTGPAAIHASISQQTIRFDPVASIRPGETLVYRVRVRAKQAGTVRLRAEVTSLGQSRAVVKEETVEVIEKE